jgi:hypothetical protein
MNDPETIVTLTGNYIKTKNGYKRVKKVIKPIKYTSRPKFTPKPLIPSASDI